MKETKSTSEYEDSSKWSNAFMSVVQGSKETLTVKNARKLVLLMLQLDENDKIAKKKFKATVQELEKDGSVKLDSDGNIKLLKANEKSKASKKRKKERTKLDDSNNKEGLDKSSVKDLHETAKKEKKQKKQHDDNKSSSENEKHDTDITNITTNEINQADNPSKSDEISSSNIPDKNKPCKGNSQGVTRLFVGNLPFAVDETSLGEFLPGTTHIKWITDKETGKFYGSAFIEMNTSISAAHAVTEKAGTKLLGRPIKINYAPARPGEKWPPEKTVITGAETKTSNSNKSTTGAQAGGVGIKAMNPKPPDCTKLFIGNLSYDIDDDTITKFFANVDAEVKAVRWIHHKDSGDFKGVGFVEFWNTEACGKAATLNGKSLLGRPIRIDWTD